MEIKVDSNWRRKRHGSKIFFTRFNIDFYGMRHLLVGVLNFWFLFTWMPAAVIKERENTSPNK